MLESEDFYASLSATAVALTIDQYETGRYGDGFQGAIVANGVASFVFESPGADITLYAGGYDIDTRTEVEVFVNDISIGHLARGRNNTLTDSSFEISSQLLQDGTNTLTFKQTPRPDARWGVTEILLLGPDPHRTVLDIDPEFSDDGYVAWQTADKFYLGRMDLDTGVFLDVLNEVNFTPLGLEISQQGPEVIRTAEGGIAAIGMAVGGLVYYSQSEEYLLAGTQGYLVGFLPKGEMPGLRFTMRDANLNVFLYDDGVISALDLAGGRPTSWLNESEFVVSYKLAGQQLIRTYNLDTGAFTDIPSQIVSAQPKHSAAFTASDGEQFVALSGGNYHEIWRNIGNGWEFVRQISSPFAGADYFYSVEFFEWQGHIFLGGEVAAGTGGVGFDFNHLGNAALCDIDAGTWTQISPLGSYIDPEILVLNGDSIAYYYTDWGDRSEYFFTTTYTEVLGASVPDPNVVGSVVSATRVEASTAEANGAPSIAGAAQIDLIRDDSAMTLPQQIADAGASDAFVFRPLTADDDALSLPPARHGFGTAFDRMFMAREVPFWSAHMSSEQLPPWQQKLDLPPLVAALSRGSPALLWNLNFSAADWSSPNLWRAVS